MTKKDNNKVQTQTKPPVQPRSLRSAANIIADSSQITVEVKKNTLILDRELDQMKIIKQFQMKRKLLMKALKQKQQNKEKKKSKPTFTIDPFQNKEGIHQVSSFAPTINSLGISAAQQVNYPKNNSDCFHLQKNGRTKMDPMQSHSQRTSIGVQASSQHSKTKKIKKSERQGLQVNRQDKVISSLKENEGGKLRKSKKSAEEIQKIRNHIVSLFFKDQTEGEYHSDSMSISYFSSRSSTSFQNHKNEVLSTILSLNNQIESYYGKRYLREVILNQYKQKFNPTKSTFNNKQTLNKKDPNLLFQPSTTQKIQNHYQKFISKSPNSYQNINVGKILNFENRLEDIEKHEILSDNQSEYFEELRVKHEQKKTRTFNARRNGKSKRTLINQRFRVVVQKQSLGPLIKESVIVKGQPTLRNLSNKKIKIQKSDSQNSNHLKDFYDYQSDDESTFNPLENWVQQFKKQAEILYEKYPCLKQFQKSQSKFMKTESQHIQLKNIENYCSKKKKIKKLKRQSIQKQQKKKSFKQKLAIFSNNKEEFSSESMEFFNKKIVNEPMKLKKIDIGKVEEDEFCKSFDHRRFKLGKESQHLDEDLKEKSFQNIFFDSNQKSHQFFFESQSDKVLTDSSNQKLMNNKMDPLFKQKVADKSQSLGRCSMELEDQNKKKINKQWSFFKSQDGKQYFYMSEDLN